MGQKVNPIALRLGIHQGFKSVGFYPNRTYKYFVLRDIKIRDFLLNKLKPAGVGDVIIERSIGNVKISIFVVRPGIVIGRGGTGLEDLKKQILDLFEIKKSKGVQKLELRVEPIKEPNLNAYLVAKNIADQLINRMSYRRVVKSTLEKVINSGAKGVRIVLSGRIGGSEIGRRERFQTGKVSLSTIRENIDYAQVPALTKSGYIGVKVWIDKN